MKLSDGQMNAFAAIADQDFEDRLVKHVQTYFPDQCAALGPAKTREVVRAGVARAREYGFKREDHIGAYVSIVFTFGDGFDRDRQFPWARTILRDENIRDPQVRIDRLHEAACRHLAGLGPSGGEG